VIQKYHGGFIPAFGVPPNYYCVEANIGKPINELKQCPKI
jgi:hypothetical protein